MTHLLHATTITNALSNRFLLALCLVAGWSVGGCSQSPSVQTEYFVGQDYNATHGAALVDTAQTFGLGREPAFGPGSPVRASSDGGGANNHLLLPDQPTDFRLTRNFGVGLRQNARIPLAQGVSFYAANTIAVGTSRYHLPDGIGVFTDPTTVNMTGLSLQPELGLARDWDLPGLRLTTSTGMGLQASATRSTIRSALLDVKHNGVQAQPYATIGVSVQEKTSLVTANLQARLSHDGLGQLRADMSFPMRLRKQKR